MIKILSTSTTPLTPTQTALAQTTGKRLLSKDEQVKTFVIKQDGTTYIAKRTGDSIIVICIVEPSNMFISTPRILGKNDGYSNKTENNETILSSDGDGNTAYPLIHNTETSQVLLESNGDSTISSARNVQLYGNIDWVGNNTAKDGELSNAPILTWRGPVGRSLPFDTDTAIEGLTTEDITFSELSNPKYTCFGDKIYQNGEIAFEAPQATKTNNDIKADIDISSKILGAAYTADGYLVCVIVNHYANIVGFWEEVWINKGSSGLYSDKDNPNGWRKLAERETGRPTYIWAFNKSGAKCTQGLSEYTIDVAASTATLVVTPNTSIKYKLTKTDNGDHSNVYSGSTIVWSDYKGDERVFAKIVATGGHSFTYVGTNKSTQTNVPIFVSGIENTVDTRSVSGPDEYTNPADYKLVGSTPSCSGSSPQWTYPQVSCGTGEVVYTDGISTFRKQVRLPTGHWCTTAISNATDNTYTGCCFFGGDVMRTCVEVSGGTRITTVWGKHYAFQSGTEASGAKTAPPQTVGSYPALPDCFPTDCTCGTPNYAAGEMLWAVQTSTEIWQCDPC